jgi:hypothetical protein
LNIASGDIVVVGDEAATAEGEGQGEDDVIVFDWCIIFLFHCYS